MPRITSRTITAAADSADSHFDQATLFEFSKVINSSLDLKFVLGHVLLTIMGKILASRGMVLLADGEAKNRFVVEMVKGFPGELVGSVLTIDRIPKAILAVDGLRGTRAPWGKFFRMHDVTIVLPLFIAETPIGLLAFGRPLTKKKLQKREQTYLRSLANISATAIETSRTIEELRQVNRKLDRKVQEMNTLFEMGKEFSILLDPDKLVRLLVFSLLGQIGVNRYVVALKDGTRLRVVSSRLEGVEPQGEVLNRAAALKAPILVETLPVRHTLQLHDALAGMGMTVVVPMKLKGESRGLILLGEKLSREPFSPADLEFLASLSNLAIISLENARLFKEAIEKQRMEDELLIAREIQKGLLPSVLPQIPGMEVVATNISSKQVGGDYYDLIRTGDGRSIIAIGDVSGKGTPAALLMANLQATIRALVPLDLPLSGLTRRVNDLMCENTGSGRFVTFFWGFIDPRLLTLSYVNAGHNYPYLVHADGSIDRLDKGGIILGVMKAVTDYEQATVSLRKGDVLLLFTDGVSEAMNMQSEEFGEERLELLLRSERSSSASSIMERIQRGVQEHVGGASQSDDITMMVVRVS